MSAGPAIYLEAAMQRIVRVTAGDSVNGLGLAPHDLSYSVGADRCFPCKLIRITAPSPGRLRINAMWTGPTNALHIWLTGTKFSPSGSSVAAEASVGSGEILVYVGWSLQSTQSQGSYITFNLSTTIGSS